MDKILFDNQYSTKPEGKKKNITLKASGMIHIILACTGSGGVGFNHVCNSDVNVINKGKINQGSGAAKSCTHPTHGALRISTEDNKTQYNTIQLDINGKKGTSSPVNENGKVN